MVLLEDVREMISKGIRSTIHVQSDLQHTGGTIRVIKSIAIPYMVKHMKHYKGRRMGMATQIIKK